VIDMGDDREITDERRIGVGRLWRAT
jgi:hypothetical protein